MRNLLKTIGILFLAASLASCGASGQKDVAEGGVAETQEAQEGQEAQTVQGEQEAQTTQEAQAEQEAQTTQEIQSTQEEQTEEAPAPQSEEPKPALLETVTVMLYMTGSDLESSAGAATKDMEEIAQSGIDTEGVNLLIFTGGAKTWHGSQPQVPTDANVVYQLTEDGYREVTRFSPLSMGDPENLTRFLTYCAEEYSTDVYDLILWDHGNGPVIGYGSDKQYSGDSLTLPEMREALENSPFGEENKLGIIGFDACLMSSAELMCVAAPYARYMVASQETEPHFGWNYDFLAQCGRVSQEELCRLIVEEYSSFCADYFESNVFFRSDVTLAAVDLSCAQELEKAVNALFAQAARDVSGDYNKLAVSRIRAHGFGRASTGSEYDLVDLESLMDTMAGRYPAQTKAVRDVIARAVLVSDSSVPESCGLSLFYPYFNKNYYRKAWKKAYGEIGVFKEYRTFLSRYEQVWLGTDLKDLFEETLVPKAGSDAGTFSMQLTDEQLEQYASSCYYILRREGREVYAPVYVSTDIQEKKGVLTAHFDGNILYYSDNYGKKGIPSTRMWDTLDGVTNYTLYGSAYREENGKGVWLSCDIQAAVDRRTGELTVKGIYPSASDGELSTGKREPLDLSEWTQFNFVSLRQRYLTRDENGRIPSFWEWPEGDWTVWTEMPLANGLHFTYEPLYDDGKDYFIMFEVSDVQGNRYASELLPVTLAKPPEQEQTIQTQRVRWQEGDTAALMDEQGVRADLEWREDRGNGRPIWRVHVYNDNSYPVEVLFTNFYINDSLYTGEGVLKCAAAANGEGVLELTGVETACRMAGIEKPEKLHFGMRAQRSDTKAFILFYRGSTVVLGEKAEQGLQWNPTLSAKADPQVLLEQDGVKAELIGLGSYSGWNASNAELTARVKFTNQGDTDQTVSLLGAEVDGIYFHDGRTPRTLRPGETWYTGMRKYYNELRNLDCTYSFYDREEKLSSIGAVNLLFKIGDHVERCAVSLSEKGTQERIEPEGKVLYEDEGFVLYVSSFRKERHDGQIVYIWDFWAENTSDEMRTVSLKEESATGNSLFLYTFAPHSCASLQGYSKRSAESDSLRVFLQFIPNMGYGYTVSDTFVLPAAE